MSGSWYEQGFDGMDAEQRRLDEMRGPQRLWMPGGASKDVVLVDDEPFCIHEHNPKIGGNFMNWLTCLQGAYDEVVCCQMLGPKSRYYIGYTTLVDCSKWQDKRGNWHQYELRLAPFKMKAMKRLKRKKEDKGALVGTMWTFTREDNSAPVVGDDWEFKRDVEMEKMFPYVLYRGTSLEELWSEAEQKPEAMEQLKRTFKVEPDSNGKLPRVIPAFNYFEVLKPQPPKDVRLMLGAVEPSDDDNKPGGAPAGGAGGAAKEEEVPF